MARASLGSATSDLGVAFATILVVVGLGFKVSIAPFHMWTPDVYQGAPTPVAAFFSVGPKAAGFSGILMIFATVFTASRGTWSTLFIVLSILTMFVGSVLAIAQKNVKRMLAYSSIAHVGYLTAGLAALGKGEGYLPGQAILFYLAAYTVMNLGAFGILTYLKTQQPDTFDYSLGKMAGLGRRSPWAAVLMSLFMFSLTGIPGTAGFIGKFFLFNSVVRADLTWLAVIAVIFSAVSAFYYLRVVIYMFFREPEEDFAVKEPINGIMAAALSLSALGRAVDRDLPQHHLGLGRQGLPELLRLRATTPGDRFPGPSARPASSGPGNGARAVSGGAPDDGGAGRTRVRALRTGACLEPCAPPCCRPSRETPATPAYALANLNARRSMNGRSCHAHVVSSTSGLLHTVQPSAAASMAW